MDKGALPSKADYKSSNNSRQLNPHSKRKDHTYHNGLAYDFTVVQAGGGGSESRRLHPFVQTFDPGINRHSPFRHSEAMASL